MSKGNSVAMEPEERSLFEASIKIYPRAVAGRFAKLRWAAVWITQFVFYGLPWLTWGDRPAVLFDLEARRFFLMPLVFYPQDFVFLAALLVFCALSLFWFTALAGRVWCGYACPQTVYSEIFMWIERKVEGDRAARMRLDAEGLSAKKLGLKTAKHALWIALALWTGLTFVGYFTPIRTLLAEVIALSLGPWQTFWVLFYGFATYGNAGFMREQVCKYMCPYARFQGAMFDRSTMVVSYDSLRGEPRGARSKKADPQTLALGSCVDCSLCVQVCPTGIDIRKGQQYECIACAACVDVCDSVMDKFGYPRGLVGYATLEADSVAPVGAQQATQPTPATQPSRRLDFWKTFKTPRNLIYASLWSGLLILIAVGLAMREPLRADIVRDRAGLARIVSGGQIENVYRIQLMNATEDSMQVTIATDDSKEFAVLGDTQVSLRATEARWVVVRVRVAYGTLSSGAHPIRFMLNSSTQRAPLIEKSIFYVPR